MKKTIIVLNLLVLTLFISGCGCSKKEEKVLKCSYEDEFVNDSFTIYFDNEIAKSFDSEKTYYFSSNEEAQTALNELSDSSVRIDGSNLIVSLHYDYEENEKLTYDEALEMYISYDCE